MYQVEKWWNRTKVRFDFRAKVEIERKSWKLSSSINWKGISSLKTETKINITRKLVCKQAKEWIKNEWIICRFGKIEKIDQIKAAKIERVFSI